SWRGRGCDRKRKKGTRGGRCSRGARSPRGERGRHPEGPLRPAAGGGLWPGAPFFSPARSGQGEGSPRARLLLRARTAPFPVSCAPDLQGEFDRAVAILHSFFYEESERRFRSIAERDPHCAMAWWGVAMSLWHPLWDPPDSASLARGWDAIRRADSLGTGSDRERGFITALSAFYRGWNQVDHRTRAVPYEHAMEEL